MMKKLIILFAALAVMPLCASAAFAQVPPIAFVGGQVYSIDGGSVDNLYVDVECINGIHEGEVSPTVRTYVGGNGYYSTHLICGMGDTVEVTVSDGDSDLGSNTGVVDEIGSNVNVGFSNVNVGIPEFSAAIIPMILTMLSFGMVRTKFF